ncbi:MAG: hypothetical protein ABI818_16850 [Acidobacteriota bacterium]
MRLPLSIAAALVLAAASLHPLAAADQAPPAVSLVRLPDGGIQPQAVVDADDVLHVLYFKGKPAGGDLFYVRRGAHDSAFSAPLRVNSLPGTALATGSVRGGQIALGRNGRVHVAWHGSADVQVAGVKRMPVWYARLGDDGQSFAPQINVAAVSTDIDGSTIAADSRGNVYVAWHGLGATAGESNRQVYVARSKDEGAHFGREEAAPQASTGACGCCGLRAIVDHGGTAHILYRSARNDVHREATWITLSDAFPKPVALQAWEINVCPMSTFAMTLDGDGLIAAWETAKQIYYARLDPPKQTFSAPVAVEGQASRKHPSIATNAAGLGVVAWTEGTAWARGGTLAWQAFDRTGRRVAGQSNAAAVPVWGLVAVVAHRDGSFAIIH